MQSGRRITSTELAIFLGIVGVAVGIVQVALPALDIEIGPTWGLVLLIVAALLIVGAVLALLWPYVKAVVSWIYSRIKIHLPIIGVPAAFGLLLGLMEWLISQNSYGAVGIGLIAYFFTQLSFIWWSRRVERLENDKVWIDGQIERLHAEMLEREQQLRETEEQREELRQKNEELTAEVDVLREKEDHLPSTHKTVSDLGVLGSEELKQYSLDIADELHEFLMNKVGNEYMRMEAIGNDLGLEVAMAEEEAMSEFQRHLKRRVMTLLAELKRRGWPQFSTLPSEEQRILERPEMPSDLQRILEYLEAVGYETEVPKQEGRGMKEERDELVQTRCEELATELIHFDEEVREKNDTDEKEFVRLFNERFKERLDYTYEFLKHLGWWHLTAEEEWFFPYNPTSPDDLETIAKTLAVYTEEGPN